MILGQGIEGQSDYNLHQMDLMIQPSIELGQQAGKQILERLERPTYPIKNIVLTSTLSHRIL
jgi:DNA-binding LacI/PurR family transcriptional regulator